MTARATTCLLMLLASVSLAGCLGPRQVYRDAERGEIALPANSDAWPLRYREKAREMVAEQFPDGYVVDCEYEAVVGQSLDVHDRRPTFQAFGGIVSARGEGTVTEVTTEKTEHRIRYRAKTAPPLIARNADGEIEDIRLVTNRQTDGDVVFSTGDNEAGGTEDDGSRLIQAGLSSGVAESIAD